MNAKELLLKAADHMDKVGKCEGNYWEGSDGFPSDKDRLTRPCCLLGAIRSALLDPETGKETLERPPEYSEAINLLRYEILRQTNGQHGVIVVWNDDPEHTKEQAVAALRAAAGA